MENYSMYKSARAKEILMDLVLIDKKLDLLNAEKESLEYELKKLEDLE